MYFEIIESTLLVEALRVDYTRLPEQSFCEHCGMVLHSSRNSNRQDGKQLSDQTTHINMPARVSARTFDRGSNYIEIPFARSNENHGYSNHSIHNIHIPSTAPMTSDV